MQKQKNAKKDTKERHGQLTLRRLQIKARARLVATEGETMSGESMTGQ